MCVYIYIYIYIHRERYIANRGPRQHARALLDQPVRLARGEGAAVLLTQIAFLTYTRITSNTSTTSNTSNTSIVVLIIISPLDTNPTNPTLIRTPPLGGGTNIHDNDNMVAIIRCTHGSFLIWRQRN